MLIRHGRARTLRANRRLAWPLAAIAGALNAAGFTAVGLYSSNMTGNVSALANSLALVDLRLAGTYMALVLTFMAGAVLSTVLINAGRRQRMVGIYAASILAEALLLTGLGFADLWLTGVARGLLLAYGLSFLMGLQNTVVTLISGGRIRATHVTGMITDFGIELGNLADAAGRRDRPDLQDGRTAYDTANLFLHGMTVLAFLAGGVAGVLAYRAFGAYLLLGAAALLLLLALPGLLSRRSLVTFSRRKSVAVRHPP